MKFIRKPFGYEPVLTKEDVKGPVHKKKGPRANNWKNTLLRIWKIVDERRALLIAVLLLVVVSSAMALLGPYLIGHMIDEYVLKKKFDGMLPIIIGLVFIYIVLALSLFFQNYWMIGIAQETIYRMRTGVFHHLLHLPVTFLDRKSVV